MQTAKVYTYKGAWCGVKGFLTVYHLDNSLKGLRVSVTEWETGITSIKLIKGDGRTADFKCFFEISMPTAEFNR